MSRLFSINSLKQFRCRVLFSTDLTARGIDARNVNLVINADVAWDADTHLHRTGRAGRYGTKGVTVTVAAEEGEEYERLRKIAFKTGSKIWDANQYCREIHIRGMTVFQVFQLLSVL